MTFRLTRSIPYEGDSSEDFATIDQVKEAIKKYQASYGGLFLDEISVIEIAREIDVYKLMEDTTT